MNRSIIFVLALTSTAYADEVRYSLPWQLRPATVENMVRVESSGAVFNDANGNIDMAASTIVAGSYVSAPRWAATLRLGFIGNNAPGSALDGSTFSAPLLGVAHARTMGNYRLTVSAATTIPLGNDSMSDARTNLAAMSARPADDTMFDADYVTEIVGVDAAYVNRGFTAQAEVALRQGIRVRGSGDDARTSAVLGLHVGYFLGSHVALSTDLRRQQGASPATTLAIGPRLHFRLAKDVVIRPGLSYMRGLEAHGMEVPFLAGHTNAVQLDIPVTF